MKYVSLIKKRNISNLFVQKLRAHTHLQIKEKKLKKPFQ